MDMPRKPRENVEGGIYHVYARGNDRRQIYADSKDCLVYLDILGRVVRFMKWRCMAYCLMRNHVHLLIETPDGNLSAGMQQLHGQYAQRFNARHGAVGHLFQGRYGATRISSDAHLHAAAAYIALNPVEAGLCTVPEEWKWSSFRAASGASVPNWVEAHALLDRFELGSRSTAESLERLVKAARCVKGLTPTAGRQRT